MNILSFNLRYDNPKDGANSFFSRRERVIKALIERAPDVVGFQEVLPEMLAYLRERLPGYVIVGCGRECDYMGEHNPIAINAAKFELISLDVSWLSPTPSVPGSRFARQSLCPRIVTHAVLFDRAARAPFHFYNTHLDHESSRARVLGAGRLIKTMAGDLRALNAPIILTGDFNAHPDSPEIYALTHGVPELSDLTEGVGTTWHGFGKASPPRIDYIFARGFTRVGAADTWRDCVAGVYLSDHYPVGVNVERGE